MFPKSLLWCNYMNSVHPESVRDDNLVVKCLVQYHSGKNFTRRYKKVIADLCDIYIIPLG